MSLIACPECQNEVSDSASACPKCGRPMASASTARGVDWRKLAANLKIVGVVVACLGLVVVLLNQPVDIHPKNFLGVSSEAVLKNEQREIPRAIGYALMSLGLVIAAGGFAVGRSIKGDAMSSVDPCKALPQIDDK